MEQGRNNETLPETVTSIFTPQMAESKRIIKEKNGFPTYAAQHRTMSISSRVLDGLQGRQTPKQTSRTSGSHTVASRLHAANQNVKMKSDYVGAALLSNEAIKDSLCKHS